MSLSYIAGLIASDGHLAKKDFKIKITTTNLHFANAVKRIMSDFGVKASIYKGAKYYEISVYDKKLWKVFVEDFKIPFGKKSYSLQKPPIEKLESKIDFLRGLFDGDSSIFETTAILRRKNKIYKYFIPRIEFPSKSKPIVNWSADLLKNLGFRVYIQKHPKLHKMYLDGAKNMKKFSQIGFAHPDKQKKLEEIISLYKDNLYYRPCLVGCRINA